MGVKATTNVGNKPKATVKNLLFVMNQDKHFEKNVKLGLKGIKEDDVVPAMYDGFREHYLAGEYNSEF